MRRSRAKLRSTSDDEVVRTRATPPSERLAFEQLEDRIVLAVDAADVGDPELLDSEPEAEPEWAEPGVESCMMIDPCMIHPRVIVDPVIAVDPEACTFPEDFMFTDWWTSGEESLDGSTETDWSNVDDGSTDEGNIDDGVVAIDESGDDWPTGTDDEPAAVDSAVAIEDSSLEELGPDAEDPGTEELDSENPGSLDSAGNEATESDPSGDATADDSNGDGSPTPHGDSSDESTLPEGVSLVVCPAFQPPVDWVWTFVDPTLDPKPLPTFPRDGGKFESAGTLVLNGNVFGHYERPVTLFLSGEVAVTGGAIQPADHGGSATPHVAILRGAGVVTLSGPDLVAVAEGDVAASSVAADTVSVDPPTAEVPADATDEHVHAAVAMAPESVVSSADNGRLFAVFASGFASPAGIATEGDAQAFQPIGGRRNRR